LLSHVNAVAESHVILDVRGRGRRLRVVPRGVLVGLSVHRQRVVPCLTLPWAAARRRTRLQEFLADAPGREVVVSLDDDRLIRLRDRRAVPSRRRHSLFLACYGCDNSDVIARRGLREITIGNGLHSATLRRATPL